MTNSTVVAQRIRIEFYLANAHFEDREERSGGAGIDMLTPVHRNKRLIFAGALSLFALIAVVEAQQQAAPPPGAQTPAAAPGGRGGRGGGGGGGRGSRF